METKIITPRGGSARVIYYENNDNGTVVKFTAGNNNVTSHSKTDSFGRKTFDELQLGTGFVSRQFSYMPGEITDEHRDKEKIKSTATTHLVSHITLSDGRTLTYEYDNEERITKVTDSIDGTTEYTYDALGQLLTEKVTKAGVTRTVNTMTYDNYGNIVSKNGVAYTYGDTVWKDKLTKVGTQSITYDKQGNPLTYLGHNLTWEKGRQLKKFDNIEYTYNANGIRTSKTVNGVKHEYTLDGTKILSERWNYDDVAKVYRDVLIPLYDNEDSVCGILYNGVPYYFLKNLQGDVIAIVDKDAQTVAKYSYDAWGVPTIVSDSSNCSIATVNPYRYRSYYYDAEIAKYYLQSRYYDANVGRFINGDEIVFATILADCVLGNNSFAYASNNPILNFDSTGYSTIAAYTVSAALYAKMGAMSAAAASLMVSIKAFVAMLWNIFVVVGLLLVAIAAIVYICKTIGTIYEAVEESVKADENDYKNKYKNKICVYVLAREKKDINSIFYVGRTKNTTARYSKHKQTKWPFYMYVVYTCNSLAQSRVVEQCVLACCLTGQFTSIIFGEEPSNKINGISKKNAKAAVDKLGKEAEKTLSLLGCTADSDWLLMMGY